MPFCPKCKYEFVDGIKKCNECGCDLVDNLDDITNESDEEIMDNENIINAELENANLGETYESLEDLSLIHISSVGGYSSETFT